MRPDRLALAAGLGLALGCGPADTVLLHRSDAGPPPPRAAAIAAPVIPAGEEEPEHPFVDCPARQDDVDQVLDEAGRRYDAGDFEVALACAEIGGDLVPEAVEAQHLRAASLAALGRSDEAKVAFAMALALDPDDPETLAAAADFFVNMVVPKSRVTLEVGLEYARRGAARAASRRRLDKKLRARLLLLEAEADNDLGGADLALPLIEQALVLDPKMVEATHERGVALFNLCRFPEAEAAFTQVLRESPDDPYAHHHLGLIFERLGRPGEAEAHFARAEALEPTDFPTPVILSPAEFKAEVDRAIAELDPGDRKDLGLVSLELPDLPASDDLLAVEPPFEPTIMGLFRGLPLGVTEEAADPTPARARDHVRGKPSEDVPPRAIVLYRINLGRAVHTRDELNKQIRRTLLHELGHLHGLDEDDLRRRNLD